MTPIELEALRKKAEANLPAKPGVESPLVHDLQVYQTELEIQNEELRSSRKALEQVRDEFARLYNQSPVGYLSIDAAGIIRRANRTFMDMLGPDPGSPEGKPFPDFLLPPDRETFLGRFNSIFSKPEGKTFQGRMRTRNGPVIVRVGFRREDPGSLLLLAVSDITEQAEAQAALHKAERLWRDTFEAMSDSVMILDLEGRIIKYNSAALRLTGELNRGLYGLLCRDVLLDSLRPRPEECPFFRMLLSRRQERQIVRFKNLWLEVTVDPLPDDNGEPAGAVHIAKDITERKTGEDKIRALLEEKQLLLKEVHHRIKNNMNVTVSLLALQTSRMENPEAVSAIEDARSRIMSMMIIYDMLYRSEDFRQVSSAEYLSRLLDAVVRQFIAESKIRLDRFIEDFSMESSMLLPLGIIINELITNAFKYAFPGERRGVVSVELKRQGNSIVLTVADDGVGMPEGRTFDNSPGFGFVLVRALAEQLEGSIELLRERGSVFVLTFGTDKGLSG